LGEKELAWSLDPEILAFDQSKSGQSFLYVILESKQGRSERPSTGKMNENCGTCFLGFDSGSESDEWMIN
jgi:hypothetical protein